MARGQRGGGMRRVAYRHQAACCRGMRRVAYRHQAACCRGMRRCACILLRRRACAERGRVVHARARQGGGTRNPVSASSQIMFCLLVCFCRLSLRPLPRRSARPVPRGWLPSGTHSRHMRRTTGGGRGRAACMRARGAQHACERAARVVQAGATPQADLPNVFSMTAEELAQMDGEEVRTTPSSQP